MITKIYARVSTKGRTNENQLRELRTLAKRLGYSVLPRSKYLSKR